MTGMLGIEYRPLFAVLGPIIVAFLILVSNKRPNLRESWTLIGSVLLFLTIGPSVKTIELMELTVKKSTTLPMIVQLSLRFGRFPDIKIRKATIIGTRTA